MLFVIVVSPTQQYLLENSLSTRVTTKVSLEQVCLCESIVRYNYYLFLFFFSIQTVAGSGYYGIKCVYTCNLKTQLYFSSLNNRS